MVRSNEAIAFAIVTLLISSPGYASPKACLYPLLPFTT